MSIRRVLRIPRGKVKDFLDKAKELNCPEIEERNDIVGADFKVFTENIPEPPVPIDWKALWSAAKTDKEKISVIAKKLELE